MTSKRCAQRPHTGAVSVDEVAASPFSPLPELRKRYWTLMAVLAISVIALIVTAAIGSGIWIAVTVLAAFVIGVATAEVRRTRRLARAERPSNNR